MFVANAFIASTGVGLLLSGKYRAVHRFAAHAVTLLHHIADEYN